MASLNDILGLDSSEEFRLKLLKQEFKLRKKQPEAWTKTKYRPYANFRTKKKDESEIFAQGKAVVQAKA